MPGKVSQYTPRINAEIKTNLMMTLQEATEEDMPTTDWLQRNNIILSNFTPQKLSRSLNELWEMGLVQKGKNRAGRMVYRLTAKMEKEGYNCDHRNYHGN